MFSTFRESVTLLRDCLMDYASYLQCKAKYQWLHHMMEQPSATAKRGILQINASLTENDTTKHAIKDEHNLQTFLQHCCVFRRYSFQIKKGVALPTLTFASR